MSYDPYKVIPAVLVAVTDGKKILLTRRQNTTYMDGWYSLPGGHVEEGETLQECSAREIKEEAGLTINPSKLELFCIYQNQNTPGRQYMGFVFRINEWRGEAGVREDKSDDVSFFDMDNLPDKIIPYHLDAINSVNDAPAAKLIFTPLGSFDPSGK